MIGCDPAADAPLWWQFVLDTEKRTVASKNFSDFVLKLRSASTWYPLRLHKTQEKDLADWQRWAAADDKKYLPAKVAPRNGKEEADDPYVPDGNSPSQAISLGAAAVLTSLGRLTGTGARSLRERKPKCSHAGCKELSAADLCIRCGSLTACAECSRATSAYRLTESDVPAAARVWLRFCVRCACTSETRVKYDIIRARCYHAATEVLAAGDGKPRGTSSGHAFTAATHDWHSVMKMSDGDFQLCCAKMVDLTEMAEHLIRRSIHMTRDGNKLVFTASSHHRIFPPAEEQMIPESYRNPSPKKLGKTGTSPLKPQVVLTDLTDNSLLDDPNKFKYDQELVVHKPGSLYWAPRGSIDIYSDPDDESYEVLGKRVVGIRQKSSEAGKQSMIRYAPGLQCPFGQIVWVGLHRRRAEWSAVAVVRNPSGKLLPVLKLMWLDVLWGDPWSDAKVTAEIPGDVEALIQNTAVLIKTADCRKLPRQHVPGSKGDPPLVNVRVVDPEKKDDENVPLARAKASHIGSSSSSSSSASGTSSSTSRSSSSTCTSSSSCSSGSSSSSSSSNRSSRSSSSSTSTSTSSSTSSSSGSSSGSANQVAGPLDVSLRTPAESALIAKVDAENKRLQEELQKLRTKSALDAAKLEAAAEKERLYEKGREFAALVSAQDAVARQALFSNLEKALEFGSEQTKQMQTFYATTAAMTVNAFAFCNELVIGVRLGKARRAN